MDWSKYALFFKESEFACSHTGKCEMSENFMGRLYKLRVMVNMPMVITSGFRDVTHPIEAKKATPGAHTTGHAADISVQGSQALTLIKIALELGFTGIGVQQKGTGRFIHLDDCNAAPSMPRPHIWSY
jgi:zinc D-Ala-D-Ala carboxypeptidase